MTAGVGNTTSAATGGTYLEMGVRLELAARRMRGSTWDDDDELVGSWLSKSIKQ